MVATQQFASFEVADLLFGIEVDRVQEIANSMDITPVPLAPAGVRGVLNLRGQIVTAIDLRSCLELGETNQAGCVNVILQAADGCTSLLVDAVGEVLEVDQEMFAPTPATLRGRLRELTRGTYKLNDRLLLVLDADRVLGETGEVSC